MKHDLKYYRSLPYTRRAELVADGGEEYWVAWIEELEGCMVDAPTKAEVFAMLDETFDDYIEAKFEWNSKIPVPEKWGGKPPKKAPVKKPTIMHLPAPPEDVVSALFGSVGPEGKRVAETAMV